MSLYHHLLWIVKNNKKLKTFLMLGIIEVKYNIRLSELDEIKT